MELSDAEILRRGLDAFAELGYQGASVRELAKRLGVSHNFINDRFGSKENFWRAVVDYEMQGLQKPLEDAFAVDADDAEKFGIVIKAFYTIAARSPQMHRIISEESVLESNRLDYLHSKYTNAFLEKLEPISRRLMESGRMPRLSMDIMFTAISGPAIVLTRGPLARRLGRAPLLPAAEWEQLTTSLAEVVLRGLLPAVLPSDS
ncbi:putative transcriptional regulator, TetR [Planotetraspora thailandica]|uniref:Putative transcriptional regulator, TetR n=1 Tax=Planotetraspora thailandica TaxID=487172 RepID=A0A8J3UUV5_9ACTN|nr:TetR/AcrR family transcriptional regulator [Planotetraspora thailandica]GII52419.1 putative transcriptional regulator, TetR [Planotetraspora thailandica]